ncbi:GPW/gp25 family protein [Paenibacillus lignilyticus]|uniref:GPW/gp25 family protein n=1 Tax=Paenibacillus lignilyticus TaxID=1172615 RepID=A0ABS5C5N8_9BACL|nr:GPW/gp25 family protein [Paenibacillus lignilyticus]MBP3961285.1 GPW/gp25 family protein [Paenibacillus lignilyticus]
MASFLGRGWKFPIEVDSTTGRIKTAEKEDDIAEAIRIILWTNKGERVMRPDFGCGIQEFVFETTDETTLRLLETNIQEAIRIWEPRVHEVEVHAERDGAGAGKLLLHISYVVRSTNNLFNQVYPFYLEEGTK